MFWHQIACVFYNKKQFFSDGQQLWLLKPHLFDLFDKPDSDYDDNLADIEIENENDGLDHY